MGPDELLSERKLKTSYKLVHAHGVLYMIIDILLVIIIILLFTMNKVV